MAPARSTEKPSAALKSTYTSKTPYKPHQWGIEAEQAVAGYLSQRGYDILSQRLKTPFGEVDILVASPKGFLVLIEVKTLRRWDWLENRIHWKQRARLRNCRSYIEDQWNQKAILYLALVNKDQIQFLPME